ncbi:hypothetical protein N7530_008805 [Penicillium desertorum]|uniref:Phosphoglycerate mutase n=1 Tax=Penicillium desertorum TaxID=1303715 RepID=A0A9W9WPX3_9EURO|nr:hypothetical protein N7530_008805 [Penicillium desertorum]
MPGRIHLVRHAEGLHNLRNDHTILDAPLCQRGFDFAEDLGRRFVREHSNSVGAITSSPLRRTIQTSLTAFKRILDTTQYLENSGSGVNNGVMLSLDANLQEITDLPCNSGSPKDRLVTEFPKLSPEIHKLDLNWHIKTGNRSPLPQSLPQRKARILEKLQETLTNIQNRPGDNDIIVVTHQGVIALLAPTANIPVGQWQTFDLKTDANGQLSLQSVV